MSAKDKQIDMTAEEAIKILQEDNCVDCGYETESYAKCKFTGDCKVRNAMNMAVEALKAKPCEDCVSRQAVLDTLAKFEKPCDDRLDFYLDSTIELEEEIKELPPVSLWKPKIAHWILLKDEYGDVIEAICSNCDNNGNHEWSICPYCSAIMVKSQESEGKK